MRQKLGILANFILIIPLLVGSCNVKVTTQSDYSAYKPVLMSRSELVNSVQMRPARDIDTVFKVGFLGNWMLVGETYQGIHVLDNSDPRHVRNLAFISVPGIIDFVVRDSVIFVNNSVDIVSIKLLSSTSIQVLDREQDVFGELQPPDGRKIDPSFVRGHRPDNTEIVAWVRDSSVDLHADSLFFVYNLLAADNSHVYGLVGQSVVVFNNKGGELEYDNLTKTNFDANYKILYFKGHLMFVGTNSMRIFSVSGGSLVFLNEYNGISPASYVDFSGSPGNYLMAVSYHHDANYWSLSNQLEIYHVGQFNTVSLDTVITLTYPLDVKFRDSMLFVCDRGVRIFRRDSMFRQVYEVTSDAQALFFADSLVVSLGGGSLSQYLVQGDSLSLLWQTPIQFSWLIK